MGIVEQIIVGTQPEEGSYAAITYNVLLGTRYPRTAIPLKKLIRDEDEACVVLDCDAETFMNAPGCEFVDEIAELDDAWFGRINKHYANTQVETVLYDPTSKSGSRHWLGSSSGHQRALDAGYRAHAVEQNNLKTAQRKHAKS